MLEGAAAGARGRRLARARAQGAGDLPAVYAAAFVRVAFVSFAPDD
jgi:hypothetical protein